MAASQFASAGRYGILGERGGDCPVVLIPIQVLTGGCHSDEIEVAVVVNVSHRDSIHDSPRSDCGVGERSIPDADPNHVPIPVRGQPDDGIRNPVAVEIAHCKTAYVYICVCMCMYVHVYVCVAGIEIAHCK